MIFRVMSLRNPYFKTHNRLDFTYAEEHILAAARVL